MMPTGPVNLQDDPKDYHALLVRSPAFTWWIQAPRFSAAVTHQDLYPVRADGAEAVIFVTFVGNIALYLTTRWSITPANRITGGRYSPDSSRTMFAESNSLRTRTPTR